VRHLGHHDVTRMPATRRHPFWTLSRREVRAHALLVAVVLWLVAAVLALVPPGRLDLFGQLKGPDFVHFYALGGAVLAGRFDLLYDVQGLYEFQTSLVPESALLRFEPVYGPQTALLFAPLAWLPYRGALLVWSAATAVGYATVIGLARRRWPGPFADRTFVMAAAAAFPPFWSLILHGQTTVVPWLAFGLAWLALERGHRFAAGAALGLLTVKPQLGLVAAGVVVLCAEWRLAAGAIASLAAQGALVWAVMGKGVWSAYAATLRGLPEIAARLEPRPFQMHSLRALTSLVPDPAGTVLWALGSTVIIWFTARAWRGTGPLAARFGVLVLASVLVSPHLTAYDATVLALAVLLCGGWVLTEDRPSTARFWPATYWLVVSFLVPVAWFVRVQPSVILQAWLFWMCIRRLGAGHDPPVESGHDPGR